MASKKGFKPLLVWYDETGHMLAEEQAQLKLSILDDASVWIHNQLDLDDAKIHPKRLHLNMVECFKDLILHQFKDVNQLGLSASKLIEAKEIPLYQLVEIQKEYESLELTTDVTFPYNIPTIEILKKDFEVWTLNEKQNQKVILANQLIKSLNDLENIGVKIYPANIMQATSGFISYDMASNKYMLNRHSVFG
jgi:hypothetical protein